jgi:hypothetical protein
MMDCRKLFDDVYGYIEKLEMDNSVLNRRVDEITRENIRLKDNEKEMFRVSTIITTSNENAKLKSYISILEKQLGKYRADQKVLVYEDNSNTEQVEEEDVIDIKEDVIDIKEEGIEVQEEIVSETNNDVDDDSDEDIKVVPRVYKVFCYKEKEYLMDEEKNLYENIDGEPGENIGRRKLNTKTGKWKTILFEF